MRTSSDSFPIVLALAAFVLMFLGQSTYQMLVEGWLVQQVTPWLGGIEAQVVERLSAVAVAGTLSLYVTGALYFRLRREFARQLAQPADASTPRLSRIEPRRDVWLYDAICRIFLGRWDPIALKRGKLDLDSADGEVLQDLVTRHLRQLAAEGTLPIWDAGGLLGVVGIGAARVLEAAPGRLSIVPGGRPGSCTPCPATAPARPRRSAS